MFRSLIIAPSSLREAVMSQPLLATLARRGEVLAVAASPTVAPVYRAMGRTVAQVYELALREGRIEWSARRAIGAGWRRRYDVAYVLSDDFVDTLLPWLAGVPRRVGHDGAQRWLLNERIADAAGEASSPARFLALAAQADLPRLPPRLQVSAERVSAACAEQALQPGRYWVLAPGSDSAARPGWPASQFASLCRLLHERSGWPVVLLGGDREAALAQHVATQAVGVDGRVLAGVAGLDRSLALLAGAAGAVSNDNGWLHLAAALGVAQVGLGDPQRWPDGSLNLHTCLLPGAAAVDGEVRVPTPSQVHEALLAQCRAAAEGHGPTGLRAVPPGEGGGAEPERVRA
ncbi:MAG: lipopolysaccharide heptosyltransferase II [Burkholderiaceae bacterium]|nr:lipopolysaccharide heptosyltransferase II [Burkholderiaceae bacterium]